MSKPRLEVLVVHIKQFDRHLEFIQERPDHIATDQTRTPVDYLAKRVEEVMLPLAERVSSAILSFVNHDNKTCICSSKRTCCNRIRLTALACNGCLHR